jgi:CRP-like cAMP-binding protein
VDLRKKYLNVANPSKHARREFQLKMSIDPLIYDYVSREKDYPDKAVILEEGRGGDWIFIILEGQVKVKKRSKKGMVTLDTLKEGEVFGEMVLFEGIKGKRSASIVADGAVVIGTLDTLRLLSDWELLPLQTKKLVQNLVKRLRESTNKAVAEI